MCLCFARAAAACGVRQRKCWFFTRAAFALLCDRRPAGRAVVHDAEYPTFEEDGRLAERVHAADLVQAEVAAVRNVRDGHEAGVAGAPRLPRHIDRGIGDRVSGLGRRWRRGVRRDVRQERVVQHVQCVQREHRHRLLDCDRAELERQQLAARFGVEQPAPVRARRVRKQCVHVQFGEVRRAEHRQVQREAVGTRRRQAGATAFGQGRHLEADRALPRGVVVCKDDVRVVEESTAWRAGS